MAAATAVALPDTVVANIKAGVCRVVGERCDPKSTAADGQPTSTPGGGTTTPRPSGTPSSTPGPTGTDEPVDQELQAAQDALARAEQDLRNAQSDWDAFDLLTEIGKLGLDFLAGDIINCVRDPNITDCLWALVSIVPLSKLGKVLRSIPKIARLIDRFIGVRRALDRARSARTAARSHLDDLLDSRIRTALAKACTQNSFVAGTGVLTADGTVRAIERLRPGDRVLAGDPATGRLRAETVTAAFSGHNYEHLVRVTVDVDGDRGQRTGALTATEHHRFWDASASRWVRADELTSASTLRTPGGEKLRVLRTARVHGHPRVYDITVGNLHTFYVRTGGSAVLVHNEAPACFALSKLPGPGNRYRSPNGLVYGEGSKDGHRILHVLEHGRENYQKAVHSVFKSDKSPLEYVDEAWAKRHTVDPIRRGNRQVYIIPMGRTVGTQGEKYIRIVVENGNEVITAFPQQTKHL
ncbi:polymorphic toxin-type HINT domain-containing protein [Actinomadura keratinilytica]|uniref:polymorphic toxin-type HINT domain-containing protein n=1 Tax=Actinomadura keratinilytica TaxID=547461 RepID=UPI0031E88456